MEGSSKKPKLSKAEKLQQKKLRRKLARLKQPSLNIPASVAQSPQLPDSLTFLTGSNYQLIFKRYNHQEDELAQLDGSMAKALINKLSMITEFDSNTIKQSNLIRDKVEHSGAYASLYDGLEPDVELVEIKFGETGRIFCYLVDNRSHQDGKNSNYCCIIAIKTRHLPT